ncbi:MAG: secretin N-terminal domain-containing protein [Janthinobacterium lividum]
MPLNFKNAAALALASGLLAAPLTAQAAPKPAAPTVRALTSSADDVTLDFVGADINDVLKALAMQTHTNIVSGNDVKGPITVSLANVSLEEALDLITRLSSYQYAKVGRTYVVGSPSAIQTLTAAGTAQAPAVTAVLSFSYSDPQSLTDELKQLYPNLKTSVGKAVGSQAGGVLVVTGSSDDVDGARRIVADSESAISRNVGSSVTELYKIKYASADDLQTVLNRLVPSLITTPAPVMGMIPAAPITADSGGTTSTTTSYGGSASGTGGTTTAVTSNIAVKPTTTALLLTGSAEDISHAHQVLATVDVRPLQINYEAKVIETSASNDDQFGLTYDFGGAQTTVGELLQPGETASNTPIAEYPGKILKGLTVGRTPITDLVTIKLNALFNDQATKILASPNISAIDGQPAATFVGDTVSYISSVTQSATGQNITTSTVNAGIKLYVTGKVNNDGYITMNVHPEVSLVTLSTPGAGGVQTPDVRVREATTTVRVKDGETLVISGLINDQDVKTIQKVPILGDIPFFGQLFRNTQRQHTHDQVMIFIKVSIQKDAA